MLDAGGIFLHSNHPLKRMSNGQTLSTFKTRKKSGEADGPNARSFWTSIILSRSFGESPLVPVISNKGAVYVQASLPGAALQKDHNVMLVSTVRGTYSLLPGEQMQLVPVARFCAGGAAGGSL